ncbi:PRC-barrel domain-containing protein [Paraburkholderia unamae]|uniref:Sporulation protein YlmC with PRC-barrel domain n=1 Tax=Paraburkholderia unamae TaxID=219649 RepID=A0ABX5KAR9_9BURK|nr:PRC-barrel domain-containing protein [Paraburkholderia unamae]PVX72282.1 sporulation protein YlmC with PRC-barrel domain [Paraburkholderia unamae]CAG9259308.1 Sporulation protein YlmC, PRC-barrel domain family [Paraburkholderia unamae]
MTTQSQRPLDLRRLLSRHAVALAVALGCGPGFFTLALAQGAPQNIAVQRMATVQSGTGFRASKLVGSEVYDNSGSKIGAIDDIVLESPNDGAFAILSVGGFLGMGKHLVAVPFNDLRISSRQIVLQADKAQLKAMPEFNYAHD